jgi:hypothetical protein
MRKHILFAVLVSGVCAATARAMEALAISKDGAQFVLAESGKPFIAWGFNYDRDYRLRLIEEYWDKEWDTVARDFRVMKGLGANVVRVHIQFCKFMEAPDSQTWSRWSGWKNWSGWRKKSACTLM